MMESLHFLYGKVLMLVLTFELVSSTAQNGPGFLGCFLDKKWNRALEYGPEDSSSQSVERCFKVCLDRQDTEYKYAGLEYEYECFCGNSESYGRHGEKPRECNDRCSGNADQLCGDSNRISIYEISQGVCTNPVNLPDGTHSVENPPGLSDDLGNLNNFKFFGTTIHFYCDTGFILQGSPKIKCEKTGNSVTWSHDVPTCEAQLTTSTTPLPVTTMTTTTTSTYETPGSPETTEEATDADTTTRGVPSRATTTVAVVTTVKAMSPPSTGTLYAGKIAGIIVAVVLGVTIAPFLLVIFVCRRKRGNAKKLSTSVGQNRTESTFTNNTYGCPDDANAKDSPNVTTETYYSQAIPQKRCTDDVVYATPDRMNTTPDVVSVSAIQNERPTTMTEPSRSLNGQSDTEWVDNTLYGSSNLPTVEMDTQGEDGWVENAIYE